MPIYSPTGYVWSSTGTPSSSLITQKIGGTSLGVTSATTTTNGSVITRTLPLVSGAVPHGFVAPKKKTVPGVYNATEARTSGVFAHNNDRGVILSVNTNINNSANNSIFFTSNNVSVRRSIKLKQFGAKTSTAHRLGHFNEVGIAGQRSQWSTSPSGNTDNYFLPTNNTTQANDNAMFVTYKAVPGKLTTMYGGPVPTGLSYKSRG